MYSSLTQLWYRWRTAQRQRIYIIPTRAGYGYAALLLLMLLGAINYNNSLGHLLCFLLASMGQVAMHHSHRNIRLLTASVLPMEPVFCQQAAQFRLTVSNADSQHSYQIEIAHKTQQHRRPWQFFRAYRNIQTIEMVQSNNNHSTTLSVPAPSRGWLDLGKLRLASRYPLGLFYAWILINNEARVLIYPAPAGQQALPTRPAPGQQRETHQLQGEDDFAGFRSYREGEPLHRVAWKALARDDVMRSKRFSTRIAASLLLRWQDLDPLDTEGRLSQLCSWILQAEAQGYRYALEIPGVSIPPARGAQHRHRCLKALALYEN